MTSNSTVTVENGGGRVTAKLSGSPSKTTKAKARGKVASVKSRDLAGSSSPPREPDGHVNRFLLCTLIKESAKLIKASAARIGEDLPMPMIVRGVLKAYRQAAEDPYGPLAAAEPDIAELRLLNKKILREELARYSRDKAKDSEARVTRTQRLGDVTRIRAEQDELERVIELARRAGR